MTPRPPRAVVPLALLALLAVAGARAAEAPDYEGALLQWALRQQGRELEPAPEGKRIEAILVASEQIVAPSDPYPDLLNWVHVRTQEPVIRREVLLEVGQPWDSKKAAETERNLRRLAIIAVAQVVPLRGSTPDSVGVLVVTKDLWSLRLNSEYATIGPLLQRIRLRPSETNFLGLGKRVSLDFYQRLDTFQLGGAYLDPRLFGTRLFLEQSAALIFNRSTNAAEGSRGALAVGLPLYALDREWGFTVSGGWAAQTTRLYRGSELWLLPFTTADGLETAVPYVYEARELAASALVTRSFGRDLKLDLSAGAGGYHRRFDPPASSALTAEQRAFLVEGYLPRSETATYLTAITRVFEPRYARLRNLDTFALTEDYQLGPFATAQVRWAPELLRESSGFVEAGAAARYRWLFGEADLLTVSVGAAARHMPGVREDPWVNRVAAAEVKNAFPPLGIGRFVVRGVVELRANDLNNRRILLGGANGLRGAPPESQSGFNLALFNLEYRTRPLVLWTLHAGAAVFYDAGAAFTRSPSFVHAVGLGLRFLVPQFDVEPIRIDFGYALNGPQPNPLERFSSTFGQVTDVRPAVLTDPL